MQAAEEAARARPPAPPSTMHTRLLDDFTSAFGEEREGDGERSRDASGEDLPAATVRAGLRARARAVPAS